MDVPLVPIIVAVVASAVGTSLVWLLGLAALRVRASRGSPVLPHNGHRRGSSLSEPMNRFELVLSNIEKVVSSWEERLTVRVVVGYDLVHLRRHLHDFRMLNSTNALLDPVGAGGPSSGQANDEFTNNWFKLGLGQEQYQTRAQDEGEDASDRQDELMPEDSISQHGADADSPPSSQFTRFAVSQRTIPVAQRVSSVSLELMSWIRDSFYDWDFDMLKLRERCQVAGVRPLVAITAAVHTSAAPSALNHLLGIPDGALEAFVARVCTEYRDLPYHSEIHACDVMHAAMVMHHHLLGGDATKEETGALILAAMVHDLAHPGVNNSFLIETTSPLAVRYNDTSVLENYHISLAFSIMLGYDRRDTNSKAADLLTTLDKAAFKRVRSEMIALVLATSFEHHFTHIGNLKARASAAANANPGELSDEKHRNEERLLLLKMIVKAADIGHPAKGWEWHVDCAKRACAEFFHQGGCEASAGLPVNPLNNAAECNVSKSQTGFLEFMVKPAFEAIQLYLEACPRNVKPGALHWLQVPLSHLERNVDNWKGMDADESAALKAEIRKIDVQEPFNPEWFDDFATDPGTAANSVAPSDVHSQADMRRVASSTAAMGGDDARRGGYLNVTGLVKRASSSRDATHSPRGSDVLQRGGSVSERGKRAARRSDSTEETRARGGACTSAPAAESALQRDATPVWGGTAAPAGTGAADKAP